MMTREDFLNLAGADEVRSVYVPTFGHDVYFRLINADEMDRHQMRMKRNISQAGNDDDLNMRAELLAMSVCDELGKRLFADSDATLLRGMKLVHIEPLIDAIMEANGLTKKAIQDAEKNSLKILNAKCGSGSPENCGCPFDNASEA